MHGRWEGLKERLGSNGPGITIAVIALILALAGGAFAASGKLTSKQKKEVKKIAKEVAVPGPAGPKGDKGDNGAQGPKGDKGDTGTPGKDGAGIVSSPEPPGTVNCGGRGGSKFVGTATTFACNGEQGEPGEPGDPWTVGGTLPPSKMETGTWAVAATTADTAGVSVPLSFPIPLGHALEGHAHFETDENFFEKCHGSGENPNPDPGELCVYLNPTEGEFEVIKGLFTGIFSASFPEEGASPQGAILKFKVPSEATSFNGTFAVRAPAAP